MKMEIVESDLRKLFIAIESLEKRIDYGYEKLEKRINDIEHDLQLVISSSVKNRKNST